MNEELLRRGLAGLPIAGLRYFDITGSTNDHALAWAAAGAGDGSLVVADAQNAGRGRLQRRWVTNPGAALAFSLILQPSQEEKQKLALFSPLGAMAVSQALIEKYGLAAQVKWPNDVLLKRRKAAGILAESSWSGETLQGVVLGIGVNVTAQALPPADQLLFPAISVEEALGKNVERIELLAAILEALFRWRARLTSAEFVRAWEERLAFRGERVTVEQPDGAQISGTVMGVTPGGELRLQSGPGSEQIVHIGDVHLRPQKNKNLTSRGGYEC